MEEASAVREAHIAGLNPQIVRQPSGEPAGRVIGVSHDFDYPMKRGDTILIIVSSGPIDQAAPQLISLSFDMAEQECERVGLKAFLKDRVMNPAAAGTVLSQSPEAGAMLAYGGIIQVEISGGEITIPNLESKLYEQEKKNLEQMGLRVNLLDEVSVADPAQNGRIATQSPRAGDKVMADTVIDLVVYVLSPTPAPSPSGSPRP